MLYTSRQMDILNFVLEYQNVYGISPTLQEIADHFGVSKITVFEHMKALEKKKAIRRSPRLSRAIEVIDKGLVRKKGRELPILGEIAAGNPIEAIEDPVSFDFEEIIPSRKNCYLLRVNGDSMIDEHIQDGDLVVVERRTHPNNGETVVAILEGEEVTLKKFYKEKGRIRLQPANPKLSPLYTDKVKIRGVVIGVIRKYR